MRSCSHMQFCNFLSPSGNINSWGNCFSFRIKCGIKCPWRQLKTVKRIWQISFRFLAMLQIPSTINIEIILWHSQLNVCAVVKMLNHGLNHGLFISLFKLILCHIHITYILNCICVSLSKINIWISKQF